MYRSVRMLAIIVVLGLVFGGIGFAQTAAQTGGEDLAKQPAEAEVAAQPDKPASIELTGTVLSDNTFVDDEGRNFQLADTEKNQELQDMVGEKIKVKATVMENDEGDREISVISYDLIQE